MHFFTNISLQFSNNPVALLEWFLASIVLVVVVTLIYVFVLSKSPPPEGATVSKLEHSSQSMQASLDPSPSILQAETALKNNNLNAAVENSVHAVSLCLTGLIQRTSGQVASNMGISDLAYLVQARAKVSPQIAEPVYQLNNLRLKVAQNQAIDFQQASWAVSFANWLVQAVQSDHVKL